MGVEYRLGNGRMFGDLREGRKTVLEAKVHIGLTDCSAWGKGGGEGGVYPLAGNYSEMKHEQ